MIYISGQITGIEDGAAEIFSAAEKHLQGLGFQTVNPMTINHDHGKTWEEYMRADIIALCKCDSIYMLSNWTKSRGAEIERTIAKQLKIKVIYE